MRLFLAAVIPEACAIAITSAQEELRPYVQRASWVKNAGAHVTVRFLGEQRSSRLIEDAIKGALCKVAPVELKLGGLGAFPSPKKPKVLWLRVDGLERVADKIDEVLDGLISPRTQPFKGHVTLCRLRRPPKRGLKPEVLAFKLQERFLLSELTLFKSELRPLGAVHTPLTHFTLGD